MSNKISIQSFIPWVIIFSTILLFFASLAVFVLIDRPDTGDINDKIIKKSFYISLTISAIHLIWWSLFFILRKRLFKKHFGKTEKTQEH